MLTQEQKILLFRLLKKITEMEIKYANDEISLKEYNNKAPELYNQVTGTIQAI